MELVRNWVAAAKLSTAGGYLRSVTEAADEAPESNGSNDKQGDTAALTSGLESLRLSDARTTTTLIDESSNPEPENELSGTDENATSSRSPALSPLDNQDSDTSWFPAAPSPPRQTVRPSAPSESRLPPPLARSSRPRRIYTRKGRIFISNNLRSHRKYQPPRPPALPPSDSRIGTSERRKASRRIQHRDELEDQLASLQLVQEEAAHIVAEKERLRKEAEERERRAGREPPSKRVISQLSPQWKTKLAQAMDSPFSRQLATAPDGTPLTRRDFGTLYPQAQSHDDPSGWLNDEIINAYMRHIINFAHERTGHKRNETPKYHNFASQFYQNLSKRGPSSVARWAKRAKIGGEALKEVDMVFIPCNPGVHWTMMVVHPKRKLVEYFDSYHGPANSFLDLAESWLSMEMPDFDASEWKFREGVGPTQRNSQDCGVFAVTTAKLVMLGIDPEKAYTEHDLPLQRRRMVCELINGGFDGDFAPWEDDIFNESLRMTDAKSAPATNEKGHKA